jgi:hypothetical protein
LHDLNFGSDEENRLDSLFNYADQSGSFDYKNWHWEERLRLQHSPDFQTNYDFRFSELKRETFKNQETRGRVGFEHKLYDNLVTTANIFTSKTDLDTQGDIEQNGGTVAVNYWKNNPWGTLFSTYTASITNSEQSGGSFAQAMSMEEAFKDADIVYPKSWAPYSVMEERTRLLQAGDHNGLKALEKRCLETNKQFIDWECTEKLMQTTRQGQALYMHCLPADISDVSCERGEVEASVFERYRVPQYTQAGYKPYVIAAMIFLSKFKNPAEKLKQIFSRDQKRVYSSD